MMSQKSFLHLNRYSGRQTYFLAAFFVWIILLLVNSGFVFAQTPPTAVDDNVGNFHANVGFNVLTNDNNPSGWTMYPEIVRIHRKEES